LALGIALIVWLKWPDNLATVADRTLTAVQSGDAKFILAHTFQEEKDAAHWTEQDIANMWQISVLPRLSKYHESENRRVTVNANHSQAVGGVILMDGEGHKWELDTTADVTETVGGFSPTHFLASAWIQEYVVEKGKHVTPETAIQARIEGLQHDRAKLEAAGIMGLPAHDASRRFYTWDEALASWRARLEKLASGEEQIVQQKSTS
jgi:hypothetical protein